jgi:hypothetical protein
MQPHMQLVSVEGHMISPEGRELPAPEKYSNGRTCPSTPVR